MQQTDVHIERAEFISIDGTRYPLFGGGRVALSMDGVGAAPLRFVSDSGPTQHGETVRGIFHEPRTISISMLFRGRNIDRMYAQQANMINVMRWNRSESMTPATLRVTLDNGDRRDIGVFLADGPLGRINRQSSLPLDTFIETLPFRCPDPFWQDVTPTTVNFNIAEITSDLPLTLPATLGSNSIDTSETINYGGTWYGDRITITLIGPMQVPVITNQTTGKSIQLNYSIQENESVAIDINADAYTVENNSGDNLLGTVDNVSDLVDFNLAPKSSRSPTGANVIAVNASSISLAKTGVSLTYYTRHLSVYGAGDF